MEYIKDVLNLKDKWRVAIIVVIALATLFVAVLGPLVGIDGHHSSNPAHPQNATHQ